MPRTLQYRPVLIDALISNERIDSYQSVFHPADDVELMGVYLWNAHVCGALYPLMGAVEITLRNAIITEARDLLAAWSWRASGESCGTGAPLIMGADGLPVSPSLLRFAKRRSSIAQSTECSFEAQRIMRLRWTYVAHVIFVFLLISRDLKRVGGEIVAFLHGTHCTSRNGTDGISQHLVAQ